MPSWYGAQVKKMLRDNFTSYLLQILYEVAFGMMKITNRSSGYV
jgi:hypothetical protein